MGLGIASSSYHLSSWMPLYRLTKRLPSSCISLIGHRAGVYYINVSRLRKRHYPEPAGYKLLADSFGFELIQATTQSVQGYRSKIGSLGYNRIYHIKTFILSFIR